MKVSDIEIRNIQIWHLHFQEKITPKLNIRNLVIDVDIRKPL